MHGPTLLFAVLILVSVMALAVFFAWVSNKEARGVREWFFGFVLSLINIALFLAKPPLPTALAASMMQALFIGTGFLSLLGTYRFLQHLQIPWFRLGGTALVGLSAVVFFALREPNPVLSFGAGSIITGCLFMWAAALFLRKDSRGAGNHPARKFAGTVSLLHGAFLCARVLLYKDSAISLMLAQVGWNPAQLIMVEQLIMTPLIGLSVLLLINETQFTQLKVLAEEDALTGTFNRRAFMLALERACGLAQMTERPLSILVMDVDHFKSINDQYGHNAGDEALRKISTLLTASLRRGDVLGRIGGEEFAIFLPDTDHAAALGIAERIRAAICASPLSFGAVTMTCSVSIGVSVFTASASLDEALRKGDQAMYLAKSKGRNRIEYA